MSEREEKLRERITNYLIDGGLFNPEMASHERVRELLMDCREALLAVLSPASPSLSASVIREVLREFPTSTNPRFDWEEHFQKVADRLNAILGAARPTD